MKQFLYAIVFIFTFFIGISSVSANVLPYQYTCNNYGITSITVLGSNFTGVGINPPPQTNSYIYFNNGVSTSSAYGNVFAWSFLDSLLLYYTYPLHYEIGPDSFDFEYVASTTCTGSGGFNSSTRIISVLPENGTTTGTTVNFFMEGYINPDDLAGISGVKITFKNLDNNVFIFQELSPSTLYFKDREVATSSGYFSYATTTDLADGNYTVTAELEGTTLLGLINPFTGILGIIDTVSNEFIVNEATFIGQLQSTIGSGLNALSGGRSATSTESLVNSCVPWSSSFDIFNCVSFLFVPNSKQIKATANSFYENVLKAFPLGYVTDFVSILATTTQRSITIIDTTMPTALGLGNTRITLPVDNALDFILNATSSQFISLNADSGETFYEITSYYWNILVYILLAFYMIARIIGSHIFPNPFEGWTMRSQGEDISTPSGYYKAMYKTRPRTSGLTSKGRYMIKQTMFKRISKK